MTARLSLYFQLFAAALAILCAGAAARASTFDAEWQFNQIFRPAPVSKHPVNITALWKYDVDGQSNIVVGSVQWQFYTDTNNYLRVTNLVPGAYKVDYLPLFNPNASITAPVISFTNVFGTNIAPGALVNGGDPQYIGVPTNTPGGATAYSRMAADGLFLKKNGDFGTNETFGGSNVFTGSITFGGEIRTNWPTDASGAVTNIAGTNAQQPQIVGGTALIPTNTLRFVTLTNSSIISSNLYVDASPDPTWIGHYTMVYSNLHSFSQGTGPWAIWKMDDTHWFAMNDPADRQTSPTPNINVPLWTFITSSNDLNGAVNGVYVSYAPIPSRQWSDLQFLNNVDGLSAYFATTQTVLTNDAPPMLQTYTTNQLNRYVENWGNDLADGMTPLTPFRTLSRAVLAPGVSNIFIGAGMFYEANVNIPNGVTVSGKGIGVTIMVNSDSASGGYSPMTLLGNGVVQNMSFWGQCAATTQVGQTAIFRNIESARSPSVNTIDAFVGGENAGTTIFENCHLQSVYDVENFQYGTGGTFFYINTTKLLSGVATNASGFPVHGFRVGGTNQTVYSIGGSIIMTNNGGQNVDGGNAVFLFNAWARGTKVYVAGTLIDISNCKSNTQVIVDQGVNNQVIFQAQTNAIYAMLATNATYASLASNIISGASVTNVQLVGTATFNGLSISTNASKDLQGNIPPNLVTFGSNQVVQIVMFPGATISYSTNAVGNIVATIGNSGVITNGGTATITNLNLASPLMLSSANAGKPSLVQNAAGALVSASSLDATSTDAAMILNYTTTSTAQVAFSNYFTITLGSAATSINPLKVWLSEESSTNNWNTANITLQKLMVDSSSNSFNLWTGTSTPSTSMAHKIFIWVTR